jgi:hypothetical protein
VTSLRNATGMAAIAALLIGGSIAGPASPAFADHTRQHTCDQAGGTYTAGATPNLDRCVVVTSTSVTGPFGRPTVTLGEPEPSGSPFFVDGPTLPAGPATTESEIRDVGAPVVVQTARVGEPEVSVEEQNAGDPVAVPIVVPGVPVTTTRVENGKATTTQTSGYRNCKPVSSGKDDKSGKGGKGSSKVERCERTVITTTTTPTTRVTTVTTPQERVTTTTQPRETVTTTRTPSTEVFTSTQQRENCVTTTQPTSITRTTTQLTTQRESISYEQRTITTTTTSTFRYANGTQSAPLVLVVFPVAANPRISTSTTPAEPLVSEGQLLAGPPIVTVETRAGDSIVNTVCTPTDPEVTVTEGETTFAEEVVVTPAPPQVTETRETLDPIVTESRAPGEPVVTTSTRGTGKTCYNNPSTSDQRKNRC